MSLRIGRLGMDVVIDRIVRWDSSGDRLSIEFNTPRRGIELAERLRGQIDGLVGSADESFVPIVSDDFPNSTGFYTILSATVEPTRAQAFAGVYSVRIEAQRVTGYGAPLIEVRSVGARRPSSLAVAPMTEGHNVPSAARSLGLWQPTSGSWVASNVDAVRETVDGSVLHFGGVPGPYTSQFFISATEFYEGAATILMGTERLAPVIGRQVPSTGMWRLSNGLLEIEPSDGDGFALRMRMWWVDHWSPWVPFQMVGRGASGARVPHPAPNSVTVLRNTPLEVAIRLGFTVIGDTFPATLDITLRRGQRLAEYETASTINWGFGIRCMQMMTATVGAPHYRQSPVPGGAEIVMAYPHAVDQDGPDFYAATLSGRAWSFAFGLVNVEGYANDSAADVVAEYMWAGSQRMAVVVQ